MFKYAMRSKWMRGRLLVVAFAEEEKGPPRLYSGQDERHNAHESDEAAGWLWSPFFNYKALFTHRHVLILPHSLSKQQAFPLEVIAVFRERYNGDETEKKC